MVIIPIVLLLIVSIMVSTGNAFGSIDKKKFCNMCNGKQQMVHSVF